MRKEQRRTPRYTFIASAELIEQKTDVRIATRVSELSLHGCYLDMMNPARHRQKRRPKTFRLNFVAPSPSTS